MNAKEARLKANTSILTGSEERVLSDALNDYWEGVSRVEDMSYQRLGHICRTLDSIALKILKKT